MAMMLGALCLLLVYLLIKSDHRPRLYRAHWMGALGLRELMILNVDSWINRRVGLLNHGLLPAGQGLLLRNTRCVHTRGMVFPLDIVFLDRDYRVVQVVGGLKTNESARARHRDAVHALELACGEAERQELELGCRLDMNLFRSDG